MLARLCCVFCLLVSPAAALEITSDTTIDYSILDESNTVQVRGGAVLTIDLNGDGVRPILVSHINLWDDSSLVFQNGDLRGDVRVLGDNKIDFINGRTENRAVVGYGNAVIEVNGDILLDDMHFEFTAGQQVINIRKAFAMNARVIRTPSAVVNVFDGSAEYRLQMVNSPPFGEVQWASIGAGTIHVDVFGPSTWSIYPGDNRPDGDTNGDHVVDLADLNNVRNYFGQPRHEGDTFPMDGIVDLNDLNVIRNSFGQSTAVTEPSSITLCAVSLLLLGQVCHRHKRARAGSGCSWRSA